MKRVALFLMMAVLPTLGSTKAYRYFELPGEGIEQFFPIAAELSRYPLPVTRPQVLIYEAQFFADMSDCKDRGGECTTYGLYDIDPKEADVIYLNADTPKAERAAVLVHEIVHWLQEKAGRTADTCNDMAAVEAEAYVADYRYTRDYTPYTAILDMPTFTCPEPKK